MNSISCWRHAYIKQKWHSKGHIKSLNDVTTKHSKHCSWFKHKHSIPSTNVYERMDIHQQQCHVLQSIQQSIHTNEIIKLYAPSTHSVVETRLQWLLLPCEAPRKKLGSFGGAQPFALQAPIGSNKTSTDGMYVLQCTSRFDLDGKFSRLQELSFESG